MLSKNNFDNLRCVEKNNIFIIYYNLQYFNGKVIKDFSEFRYYYCNVFRKITIIELNL